MSMYSDYVAFVDGGSLVPYYVDGAKYVVKPNVYTEFFIYGMKEYYKSYNSYYIGIGCSSFVRPIYKDEFMKIKELYTARDKDSAVIGKNIQLSFSF